MTLAKIVMHYEEGSWWAESSDLAGFTVVAPTLRELQTAVREAVRFHFETNDTVNVAEFLADAMPAANVSWRSLSGGSTNSRFETKAPQTHLPQKASA